MPLPLNPNLPGLGQVLPTRLPNEIHNIHDQLVNASAPDLVFQIAPAFEDFALVGIEDPGSLILSALQGAINELSADAEIVSVPAGTALSDEEKAQPPVVIALLLVEKRRRQSIGIYAAANPAIATLRREATAKIDLDCSERVTQKPRVPFAMRLPYIGIEAMIVSGLVPTGSNISHLLEPCSCGLLHVGAVDVSRVSVVVEGGGGRGKPNPPSPGPGVALDATAARLSCTIAGLDLAISADITAIEAIGIREARGVKKLDVKLTPQVTLTGLTSVDLPDLVKDLSKGNVLQRLLAELLRPANAVVHGVRDWAGRLIAEQAPEGRLGLFGELATFLDPDILIPNTTPLQKVQIEVDEAHVRDDRLDLAGFANVVDRDPKVAIVALASRSDGGARVDAQAVTSDLVEPSFAWSSQAGTVDGSASSTNVRINYPAGALLDIRLEARGSDEPSGTVHVAAGTVALGTFASTPQVIGGT